MINPTFFRNLSSYFVKVFAIFFTFFGTSLALSQIETNQIKFIEATIPGQLTIKYELATQKPHYCSAVNLGKGWLLTAAHCLEDKENLIPEYSCDLNVRSNRSAPQKLAIKNIYIHPEALKLMQSRSKKKRLVYADLALIQLFEEPENSVSISFTSFGWNGTETLWTGGFGAQSCFVPDTNDNIKEELSCSSTLRPKLPIQITKNHFWTQSKNNDPFLIRRGDSGGGVFIWSNVTRDWSVVGINSAILSTLDQVYVQPELDSPAQYAVHVRIDFHKNWLKKVMNSRIQATYSCNIKD